MDDKIVSYSFVVVWNCHGNCVHALCFLVTWYCVRTDFKKMLTVCYFTWYFCREMLGSVVVVWDHRTKSLHKHVKTVVI